MPITRRLVAAGLPLAGLVLTPSLVHAKPAPAFTAVDIDGKTRSLAEFKGKVVVLEWVNEGCPYVKKHYSGNMQGLQQAAARRRRGLADDRLVGAGQAGLFPRRRGRQGLDERPGRQADHPAAGPQGAVATAYKAKTTPHMFVIDQGGQVVYEGAIDDTPSAKLEDLKTAKNYVAAGSGRREGRPQGGGGLQPAVRVLGEVQGRLSGSGLSSRRSEAKPGTDA